MNGIREGEGMGAGSWFDDNIRRVVGNGCNTFFGQITGLVESRYVLDLAGCLNWTRISGARWRIWCG